MPTQKLSDTQISMIVARRVRWPKPSSAIVWAKAHDCVDAFHRLVRKVDLACAEAEEDVELSVSGIARRRAELCEQTLIQLANFRSFEIAERALSESVGSLERLSYRDPQQVQMQQTLTQAREDLREGVEATKRLVRERCKVREGTPV